MEFELPWQVPADSKPQIELAVRIAALKFPDWRQFEGRITSAFFSIAEILYNTAQNGRMRPEHVLDSLDEFLLKLCAIDPAGDYHGFGDAFDRPAAALRAKIRRSPDWIRYLERLDRLAKPSATKVEETAKIQELRSAKEPEGFSQPAAGGKLTAEPLLKPQSGSVIEQVSGPSAAKSTLPMRIALNIDTLRKNCGWSLDVLAEKTGLDKKRVLAHVQGKSKPYPRTAKLYADAFTKELGKPITASDLEK
jgi:hypothetical protein